MQFFKFNKPYRRLYRMFLHYHWTITVMQERSIYLMYKILSSTRNQTEANTVWINNSCVMCINKRNIFARLFSKCLKRKAHNQHISNKCADLYAMTAGHRARSSWRCTSSAVSSSHTHGWQRPWSFETTGPEHAFNSIQNYQKTNTQQLNHSITTISRYQLLLWITKHWMALCMSTCSSTRITKQILRKIFAISSEILYVKV